jgi:hypothetical protein
MIWIKGSRSRALHEPPLDHNQIRSLVLWPGGFAGLAVAAVGYGVWSDPTAGGVVAEPVRVRRLTDQEGLKLQQIVRRGSTSSVRYRRAMMLLASAGGNRVPVIAKLVQADEDTVREVIHRFNEIGLACLDPRWAGGRPRLLSPDDEDFVIQTATTRPPSSASPSPAGHYASSPPICGKCTAGSSGSAARRYAACSSAAASPSSAQRRGRSPRTPSARRNWTVSRKCWSASRTVYRVRRVRAARDPAHRQVCWAEQGRPERHPATYHRTHGVATSTAATQSATTACGASTAAGKAL